MNIRRFIEEVKIFNFNQIGTRPDTNGDSITIKIDSKKPLVRVPKDDSSDSDSDSSADSDTEGDHENFSKQKSIAEWVLTNNACKCEQLYFKRIMLKVQLQKVDK